MIRSVLLGTAILATALGYAASLADGRSAPSEPVAGNTVSRPYVVRIDVAANENTAYGTPWDGIRMGGMIGSVMPELPTSSPPDLAVCLVTSVDSRSDMDCYHQGTSERPRSLCHDAFECSFDVTVPGDAPFGVIVLDLDDAYFGEGGNDFVDAFLVAPRGQVPDALPDAVRAAVRMMSRTDVELPKVIGTYLGTDHLTLRPNEERRRSTALKTFERGECEVVACRLSQSQVRIRRIQ